MRGGAAVLEEPLRASCGSGPVRAAALADRRHRAGEVAYPPIKGGSKEGGSWWENPDYGLGGPVRFDKYHKTVETSFDDVFQSVMSVLPPNVEVIRDPLNAESGYRERVRFRLWEDLLQIEHGGRNPVSVQTKSGPATMCFVPVLARLPGRVTRADAKFDLQGEGLWPVVREKARTIAKDQSRPLPVEERKHDDEWKGDSIYCGTKDSVFQLLCYEKSKQMTREKHLVCEPHIVRIEGRLRAQNKAQGRVIAGFSAEQVFGYSPFSRSIYEEFSGRMVEPVKLPIKGAKTLDESLTCMAAMFAGPIREAVEREGGWEKFGAFIEYLMDDADALRAEWSVPLKARQSRKVAS